MTARTEVYTAIDSERAYQDDLWRDPAHREHTNPLSIGEFLLLIEEYTMKARKDWSEESKPEFNALHGIRKIAGIAVNCMEQHGAPQRKEFPR